MTSDELQPGTVHLSIRFLDNTITIAFLENDGSSMATCEIPLEDYPDFDACTMSTSWKLYEQSIVLNDEIPLWVIIAGTDEISAADGNFRNAVCDAGIAFALTFA